MSFLDRIDPTDRLRFDAASTVLQLEGGDYLIRRGDAGGDIFVLETGALEVLDRSGGARSILAVLDPGAVVGEVSFLDDSPRSADVRARGASSVRRWAREDVRALLQREPVVAARFLESLARTVAKRLRNVNRTASTTTKNPHASGRVLLDGGADLVGEALDCAFQAKEALTDVESALRSNPHDADAIGQLGAALDTVQRQLAEVFASHPDVLEAKEAARRLRRELAPWLARSVLGQRCLRDDETTVDLEAIDHVLADVSRGEGSLGTQIDRWMLDRPSLAARRAAEVAAGSLLTQLLPRDRPRVVTLLDSPAPSRLGKLAAAVSDAPTRLILVDPSRTNLEIASRALAYAPKSLETVLHNESPLRHALGRADGGLEPADVVLVLDLPSYMPDRILVSLLEFARQRTRPDGHVLLYGIGPAPDGLMLGRLLRWPTVRRSRQRMGHVADGAGLTVSGTLDVGEPGYVVDLTLAG